MPEHPTCPHKIPLPIVAPHVFLPGAPDNARIVWVKDARECPGCLKERIRRADEILKAGQNFPVDRHPFSDPAILRKWYDYVTDFNP